MDFGQTDPTANPDFWKVSDCLGHRDAGGWGVHKEWDYGCPHWLFLSLQEVPPEGVTPEPQSEEGQSSLSLGSSGIR